MNKYLFYILLMLCGALFLSCEKEKSGIVDPNYHAPMILALNVYPSSLNLDTDTTGLVSALGNNTYRLFVTISGSIYRNGAKSIGNGTVSLYKPASAYPFADYSFTPSALNADTFQFSLHVSFLVNRSDVGKLRFDAVMRTQEGLISNTLEQSMSISRRNSKPVLSDLSVPDTIVRPTTGINYYVFSVAVSDSDGYQDISQVYFKRILPTETGNISMFDDGNANLDGDQVAGDGIFTRVVSIDSTAFLGQQVFLFRAKDNSGALSDSLLHTITIIQ